MTKLYLIQAEDIPVYFDGTLQGEQFIPDHLLVGGAPFPIPSGKLGFDDSALVLDPDRPGVFHPDWERAPFNLLTFWDGWKMVLRGNEEERLFAFKWREPDTNSWLRRFLPNCLVEGALAQSEFTLRVLFGTQVREVRFDWTLPPGHTFSLLGVNVELPSQVTLSAILQQEAGAARLNRLALLLLAGQEITIKGDFAWTRGALREVLQFDPGMARDIAQKVPAFRFDLTPKADTLVLADTDLDGRHAPTFLRRCVSPVVPLDISEIAEAEFAWPTMFDFADIQSLDVKKGDPRFALSEGFKFPFLYNDSNGAGGLDSFTQFIEVSDPKIALTPASQAFDLSVPIEIHLGSLSFGSEIPFEFDVETFAVRVDHQRGIAFKAPEGAPEKRSFLGLDWTFKPNQDGVLFTLVTEEYNYQLTMAEGAELILEFGQLSADPIRFRVSNFAVSGKGITLTAEVTDDPARLNGINTLFRFSGSRLEIVDNVIQDLTLRGSGPLPPDLVGEAIVDVSLQFGRETNGNFVLKSGGAKLQGSQLLACKATRFQFSVDAIGLQFVNDGGYHLYFTLTGSAQFVPAPADGKDHALAFLPGIKLDLVDCPLTSDISVLAKHISLLIEFPKPKKFRFLGAYEMELRAIGFIPSFDPFDGDAAMQITGQVMFADGKGDARDAKPDYHSLYIGLPEKGSFLPRIYFQDLPLNLNLGTAIQLSGEVGFLDDPTEKGFWGQGKLEIQGLPPITATFAFMRVRRNEESPWMRAWFVYVNASKLSLPLPLLKLYIREIGLGFGYRYTLVSIQAADQEQNLKDLLYKLRMLSRAQGELAKRDNWAVDLEEPGQDPRWTIVLRAMMAQNSASKSPLVYKESQEKNLSNLYLLDVVAAFRSDLTFYMAARGWLNTNYHDYVQSPDDVAQRPVLSGFILYSARRKRFLAQVASNPGGYIGTHPALPPPLKKAIQNAQVSATLLMEPGLAHFELGWPNMLRWKEDYGPLTVEYRGGFIFRVTPDELVLGASFLAQAHLRFEGGISLKVIGVRVRAEADIQFGGRLIGVVGLGSSDTAFMLYAALGIEVRCRITIEVWIDLFFWSDSWAFSLTLNFTAGLELGIIETNLGVRGHATLGIEVAGHDLHVGVSFKANEGVVNQVYGTTQKYLTMGLEATEVEAVPGIGAQRALPVEPRAVRARDVTREAGDATVPEFHLPNYNVFVIHADKDGEVEPAEVAGQERFDGWFVLIPQGQREEQGSFGPETGFLPPAPMKDGMFDHQAPIEGYLADFRLELPELDPALAGRESPFRLYHWDQQGQDWVGVDRSCSWKANWKAEIVQGAQRHDASGNGTATGNDGSLTLAEYLREAFLILTTDDEDRIPVGDPDPLGDEQVLADERVQNPSDAAFEAAVRGAVEQFRGSPFFKRDPEIEYDRVLTEAFKPGVSIYARPPAGNGLKEPQGGAEQQAYQESQQRAYQMRGLIIQKLIGDLQEWVRDPERFRDQLAHSVPFQMGLVFGFCGDPPDWLTDYLADEGKMPKIFQRKGPDSHTPADEPSHVRTFTIRDANFATNPPQFQKVRHYTDAHTIAITWELAWSSPLGNVPPESRQADPEHHLLHYEVRRRPLDSGEREVVYTVKSAQVLHRESNGDGDVLKRLKPRFQVVDHFGKATEQQAVSLPAAGRTYLYTITPRDLAGNRGRPLTIVATRYPNDPPAVPVDGQITVQYSLPERLQVRLATEPDALSLLKPEQIRVAWSKPRQQGSEVPVKDHLLVFRRDATLPIGSYGSDSDTQRSRKASLPTGSARPLPTDIRIKLEPIERAPDGGRSATLTWEGLQAKGIVPGGESPQWQPESWQVFFQTVSIHDVPSALAPVNLLLEIGSRGAEPKTRLRPAGLEWLPGPTYLPMLPPEDQNARPGVAHVPMPPQDGVFDGTVRKKVSFQKHPAGLRLLHFRWNQGPSVETDKEYPLDLIGGYDLLELDVDANPRDLFGDKERLAQALRPIAEVQMLPGDEQPFAPNNTLNTNQWEAWYPSQVPRRQAADRALEDAKSAGAWYSWRDSLLIWPQWTGLTDGDGLRDAALHPSLQAILDHLKAAGYYVDAQLAPPLQPGTLGDLMEATSRNNDPYGWAVLQHLGLSAAFSLRDQQTGAPVTGDSFLAAVDRAIRENNGEPSGLLARHLHVELLFQPGRCIEPDDSAEATPDALLATVQLSLRPCISQVWQYVKYVVQGKGTGTVTVSRNGGDPGDICQIINQSDVRRTAVQVPGGETPLKVEFPATGQTTLLVRCKDKSKVAFSTDNTCTPVKPCDAKPCEVKPCDPLTLYFPLPDNLAEEFADESSEYHTQWLRFKRYVEALNSSDPSAPRISVPTAALSADRDAQEIFAKFLVWSQRFFDHSSDPAVTPQAGSYLATAYPRTVSPALASPDRSGRLRYDHLLADQWAHTYRYYFHPYGRYEKLWRSIAQSLGWQQALKVSAAAWLDTSSGGLDVVLERTRPVAMPVVLSSSRLDAPGQPGSPALPGKWWEVIVARHPEQALIERNQTLARQLAFRQVAFSLLRRFGYAEYLRKLPAYLPGYSEPEPLVSLEKAIPGAYPDEPDHLSLDRAEPEDRITMLDLPARIGAFQQGAIALQWEALPFYYEHRLLLIAQTDSTVSAVNEVTQRAFEYVTPAPVAMAAGAERGIEIRIQLKRFWDGLPDVAQRQWASEDPCDGRLKFSGLPDPDVIYQLIEIYAGNVEAQADIYFDMQEGRFVHRQIGRRFQVVETGSPTEPTEAGGFYELPVTVQAIPETEPHSRVPISLQAIEELEPAGKLLPSRDVDECTLVWYGTLSGDHKQSLLALPGDVGFRQALKRLAEAAVEPISGSALLDQVQHKVTYEIAPRGLDQVPLRFLFASDGERLETPKAEFAQKVENGAKVYSEFTWTGIMADADEAELRRWAQIPEFHAAVEKVIGALDQHMISETIASPRPTQADVPDVIKQQLTIRGMPTPSIAWKGRWTGTHQIRALGELKAMAPPDDSDFGSAIDRIVNDLQNQRSNPTDFTYSQSLPRPRLEQRDLSQDFPAIQSQLAIGEKTLTWRGRLCTMDQVAQLEKVQKIGDQSFREAAGRIIDQLTTTRIAVPLGIPVRPTTASLQSDETLPRTARENLLIGTAALEYRGVMPEDEAQRCITALSQPADRKALEQLYRQTVRHGLHDNGLKIATRRGSASVSEMIPIPIQDLAVDGPAAERGSSTPVRGGQNWQPT